MRISDWSSDVFSSDLSPRRRRLRADLLVAEAFLDQAVVGEDVERGLEGRPRDLHMRSPAAEPLVGGDAAGKHLFVDSGKEGLLGARDLGGQLGRASSRARVCPYVYISVVAVSLKKK